MKKTFYLLSISVLIFGCKKDKDPGEPDASNGNYVIIANEGNFPDGVSSITLYNPETQETEENVYQRVNENPIGSTVNDVLVDGERTFFVANGSGSIVVANTEDLSLMTVIKDLENVMNIVKAGTNKYFVSSWGLDGVYVLDMDEESITGNIETGTGPTEMLAYENYVLVTNSGGYTSDSTVSVIDVATEETVAQLAVGDNPNSLQLDAENRLWVLSSGVPDYANPENSTKGALHVFDLNALESSISSGASLSAEKVLYFGNNKWQPKNLVVNGSGTALYFLNDGVEADIYRISTDATEIPSEAFVVGEFYALGYDRKEDELYASNPLTYTQSGDVSRFSAVDGSLLDEFKAGIIPGCFAFR